MQVLTDVTRTDRPFHWTHLEQCAFDSIRLLVSEFCKHCQVILKYGSNEPPIFMVTDVSASSVVGGLICQGKDWWNTKIAVFYSAKLNSTQMNPVHDLEFMVGVETMLRHKNLLMGTCFTWCTDHQVLEKLFTQPNLSSRQAHWLEKTANFDFEIKYIEGPSNIFADALSRIYKGDMPGMVRAKSEFVEVDMDEYMNLLKLTTRAACISAPMQFGPHLTVDPVELGSLVSNETLVHKQPTEIVQSVRHSPRIIL